jgi:hypothetical protein
MRRVLPALAGVLLLPLLLAGCVTMPTSGPVVTTGSDAEGVTSEGAPFINPRPPEPGESRPDVVRGFLAAMQATPIQTRTAARFLSTSAAAAWNPQAETITYAGTSTPRDRHGDVSITLSGAEHLDARGAWQGALPAGRRTLRFPMTLEDGEWRIDAAPNALVVPEDWFAARFRPVSIYFFDPTASILEPEPVFVPRGDQLASSLTQALLLGPGPGLAKVAQSMIPSGLSIAVGVTVSDAGVADILLNGDPGQLSARTIDLMMAQLAWTLRQEPKVQSLRLTIGGQPVPLPGGVSSYRIDGGAEYDPAGFQASPLLYGLRGGHVVAGAPASMARVDGPFGRRSYGFTTIGVSLDAERLGGVADGGRTVLVGPVRDGGRVRTAAVGTRFLRPAWDFAGRMWLVDRAAGGARVSYVDPSGAAHPIRVRGVTGTEVRDFVVSRDGTRLIAVVRRGTQDTIVESRIEHDPDGRVAGALAARRIDSQETAGLAVRDIAWRSAASIVALNPLTPTLSEVAPVSVDGAPLSPETVATAVDGRVLAVVGSPAPDEAIYGVTRRGLVDVGSAERRSIVFRSPTTSVTYVG